jgi:hypothetical protein
MSVRPATEADLPRLMGYAEAFLLYHPVTKRFPRDLGAVEAMLRKLMTSDEGVLLTHDDGVIGGVLTPLWCAPSALIASELFWWAERDGRSLMKAFEAWAQDKGADLVQMLMIMGRRDVSAVYDRSGYAPVELSFMRAA